MSYMRSWAPSSDTGSATLGHEADIADYFETHEIDGNRTVNFSATKVGRHLAA